MKWKDTTSYSRGERFSAPEPEPREWTLDEDSLRVIIHRFHGLEGLWFGSCYVMGVERRQLSAFSVEEAQREFLAYLEQLVRGWHTKLLAQLA